MEEDKKYMFPTDKLDEYIQMLDSGVELMLNDQIMLEIEMRRKELHNQLFEDEDEDEDDVYVKMKHEQMMREHLQRESRKARKEDIMIITLTDKQKSDIRESVETSFVRPDPVNPYNMTDDEIFDNAEQKLIMEKLSKLRSAYYNQTDYQNAINIIRIAIEYSLEHDYPWMSKEEAIKAFHDGKIQFTYCRIPQLRLNFKDIVKDPNILAGVASGNIELVKKEDKEFKKRSYKNSDTVSIPTHIISTAEQEYYLNAHKHGLATPISPAIQAKNTIYDRFTFNIGKSNDKFGGLVNKSGEPITFDWTQDNAAEKYRLVRNNKQFGIPEIIDMVNKENKGINNQISTKMQSFNAAINSVSLSHDNNRLIVDNQGYKQQNEEILKTEQRILSKIQSNINSK